MKPLHVLFTLLILLLNGCMVAEPEANGVSAAGKSAQVCATGVPFYGSAQDWAWGLRTTLSDGSVIDLPMDTAICRDLGTVPGNVKLSHGTFSRRGNVTRAWVKIGNDSISWLPAALAGSW